MGRRGTVDRAGGIGRVQKSRARALAARDVERARVVSSCPPISVVRSLVDFCGRSSRRVASRVGGCLDDPGHETARAGHCHGAVRAGGEPRRGAARVMPARESGDLRCQPGIRVGIRGRNVRGGRVGCAGGFGGRRRQHPSHCRGGRHPPCEHDDDASRCGGVTGVRASGASVGDAGAAAVQRAATLAAGARQLRSRR